MENKNEVQCVVAKTQQKSEIVIQWQTMLISWKILLVTEYQMCCRSLSYHKEFLEKIHLRKNRENMVILKEKSHYRTV